MTQKETLESFSDTLPSLLPAMTLGMDRPKTISDLSVQQGQEEEKEKDDEDFPVTTAVGAQEGPGQEAAVDEQGLEDEAAPQYKQTIRPTSTYSSMKQMTRGPKVAGVESLFYHLSTPLDLIVLPTEYAVIDIDCYYKGCFISPFLVPQTWVNLALYQVHLFS
jgi:hypothetical protein